MPQPIVPMAFGTEPVMKLWKFASGVSMTPNAVEVVPLRPAYVVSPRMATVPAMMPIWTNVLLLCLRNAKILFFMFFLPPH